MAGAPLNPALAPYFVAAGQRNRIPPAVLAGVADVETDGGRNLSTSSAGAVGPMQFLPSTAAGLGINPNDPAQAVDGAARLLNQYGYQQNPTRAIAAYNAGPGNVTAGLGYARTVLANAARLAPALAGVAPSASTSSTGSSSSNYGGVSGFLLKAALVIALLVAGVWLTGTGLNATLKGAPARAGHKLAMAAA